MDKVIYSKFKNQRADEFCVREDVFEREKRQFIKITPMSKAAEAHIDEIVAGNLALKQAYEASNIEVNECIKFEDSAVFLKNREVDFEQELRSQQAVGNEEAVNMGMKAFFDDLMDEKSLETFEETEEFRIVFGSAPFDSKQWSRQTTNVDISFGNLVYSGEKWQLQCAEWIFSFPIPVKYVMYRCLNEYYHCAFAPTEEMTPIYRQFGISSQECIIFAEMDRRFEQYILKEYVPIDKLYGDISQGVFEMKEMIQGTRVKQQKLKPQLYWDFGLGYSENQSVRFTIPEDGKISFKMEIPSGVRQIRFDPAATYCMCDVKSIIVNGSDVPVNTNCEKLSNDCYLAENEDPQFLIEYSSGDVGLLQIDMDLEYLGEKTMDTLRQTCLQGGGKKAKKHKNLSRKG